MVFVKKGAAKAAESGTRPGLSGQTLVSTGLADLDKLLGGGTPLGTVTLLLEDSFSQHHATLLKYFLAEGAAHDHALQWACSDSHQQNLPQKINHLPKEDVKDKQQESEEVQLRIAWQYRRYIRSKQKAAASTVKQAPGGLAGGKPRPSSASSAGIRDWCHNFDLTKAVPVQDLNLSRLECPEVLGKDAAQRLAQATQAFVQSLSASHLDTPAPRQQHPTPQPASPASAHSDAAHAVPTESETVFQRMKLSDGATPSYDDQAAALRTASPNRNQRSTGGAGSLPTVAASYGTRQASAKSSPMASGIQPQSAVIERSMPANTAGAPLQQQQQRVGRIAIQSLGGVQWLLGSFDKDVERQLFTTVLQLKALVRESRCAAMLSFPTGLYSSSLTSRLVHLCDTVIGLEAVRDNSDIVRFIPDAASCCGLLHLQKLPYLNALGPPLPEVTLFLIRHKRRRIAIQAVQTDPDAEAAEADGKSAAASLCGGPPRADKPFDF